ncbi:hypothetical protein [Methylobacterium sp. A54F]
MITEYILYASEAIERNDKIIVALGTVVIAAFTVILGIATFFLWRATADLVRGADASSRRQLRAYVGKERTFILNLRDNSVIHVEIICKNYGQTPALNFNTHLYLLVENTPFTADRADLFFEEIKPDMALMPGASNHTICSVDATLVPNLCNDIRSSRKCIVLIGTIVYQDVFGTDHVARVKMLATGERAFGSSPFIYLEGDNSET